MPESKSGSLSCAQGDSTIAFAYINVLNTRKRRFFVLKSVPKASPWEVEGAKPPMDYFLNVYKNEKGHQKSEPKQVYNLSSVILLYKCTKKENSTVLCVCFQEDTLFLKFTSEDELNRWYFHLSEIYSVKRNCRWPELLYCFSVTLKQKDLASATAKHGKPDLAGQYRLCVTKSDLLLVRDSLLSPILCLQFQGIRTLCQKENGSGAFFQIELGRLSPIGEGVLHFEVEQNCMRKEIQETLTRWFYEARSHGLTEVSKSISGSGRRTSKDSVHRSGSFQIDLRHGSSVKYSEQHRAKYMSTHSERAPSAANSILSDDQRTPSQPLSQSFDDYCDLSRDVQPSAAATSRSLNSSTSLSANSELAELDGSSTAQQQQQHIAGSEESRSSRLNNWRFDSLDACPSTCDRQADVLGSPALGSRANSIGSRPTSSREGSYLPSSYSVPSSYCADVSHTGGGHRDDKQVFVDLNFPRPRTTSDAGRYLVVGSQRFRQRTGSNGNRSAHRLGAQPYEIASASGGILGEVGPSGTELQSLREAVCPNEDDAYVPMSFSGKSASESQTRDASGLPTEKEEEEEDPYWVNPSPLDHMLNSAMVVRQQCPVEH